MARTVALKTWRTGRFSQGRQAAGETPASTPRRDLFGRHDHRVDHVDPG